MIYAQMMGVKDNQGHVLLLCSECNSPAQDARALTILKVCSNCGIPLGEWITETERDTELEVFAAEVKRNT
jgi:NMD protein affecting ribosome stability and mRNA decay